MGYRTSDGTWRDLEAAKPAVLNPTERLMLLALAHTCRDETRRGWPGVEWLAKVTGLTPSQVRRVVGVLHDNGWIRRQAFGKTSAGQPLYAANGHRSVFLVIDRSLVDDSAEGEHPCAPSDPKRGASARAFGGGRRAPARTKVRVGAPPLSQGASKLLPRAHEEIAPSTATVDPMVQAARDVASRRGWTETVAAPVVARVIAAARDPVRDPVRYLASTPDDRLDRVAATISAAPTSYSIVGPGDPRCPRHPGQPAENCRSCASERLGRASWES